jgi:hypothetical protein
MLQITKSFIYENFIGFFRVPYQFKAPFLFASKHIYLLPVSESTSFVIQNTNKEKPGRKLEPAGGMPIFL